MATRTLSTPFDNNTDANFRAWINEIHNALIAFGWLQTADTGQINYSTVTRPTATNTYQGYAIYKMNDALQSTTPFFIRFDYGTGGGTDTPALKFQFTIGGTDGAGNLTATNGVVMPQQIMSNGFGVATTTATNCRSSGTSSAFRMCFWSGAGAGYTAGWTFAVERDLDSTGANTSFGISCAWCYGNQNNNTIILGSQFLALDGSNSGIDTGGVYAMVTSNTSQTGGGNTGVGPVRCSLGAMRNPMFGLLITARGDYANESQNTVSIYGANHNYLMLRPTAGATNLNRWNADCGIALLWE